MPQDSYIFFLRGAWDLVTAPTPSRDIVRWPRVVPMKSATDGTPRARLEVERLHRLGDAVVGRRRDAVAADTFQEAHLRARGSLVGPARVARARLGQPQGWGLPLERPSALRLSTQAFSATRADTQHLVHDAPRPLRRGRTRWMPTALGSVIRELRRGLLPARAGRRGSRGGLRAANRRVYEREKPAVGFEG